MTTQVVSASAPAATNKWLVAVAVSLGALLEIVDTSIVNVALADMQASLGATLTQVSWVVSSYGIANVIILPLSAWFGLRFGKKNYFLFSLVGFVAASALCGMSTSLAMLVIARVLQGLTGGGLLAKAQAILFETFPREEQALAQGLFGAIVIAGPAIGPTLGGYLVTNVGWRWIFFVNLPLGILAVLMVMACLPKDPDERAHGPVDFIAILMLAVGVGSLQAFLEEGNGEGWFESRLIITLAVLAVVGIVLFIRRELISENPVVDLRVVRHRSLWAGSILSVVTGLALYGALFSVPIFAQTLLHLTSQQTGMVLLPGAIAAALSMPIASRVAQSGLDPRIILTGGALVLMTALQLLGRLSPASGAGDLFWPLVIRSFGTVFMFLPLQLAAIGPIPKKDVASATGFFNLTRQLGGSMGVALLATLLDRRQAFHFEALSEHLSASDPVVAERIRAMTHGLAVSGIDAVQAHQRALQLLAASMRTQAAVLSFNDTFFVTSLVVVFALPLVFLLGKPEGSPKTAPNGH